MVPTSVSPLLRLRPADTHALPPPARPTREPFAWPKAHPESVSTRLRAPGTSVPGHFGAPAPYDLADILVRRAGPRATGACPPTPLGRARPSVGPGESDVGPVSRHLPATPSPSQALAARASPFRSVADPTPRMRTRYRTPKERSAPQDPPPRPPWRARRRSGGSTNACTSPHVLERRAPRWRASHTCILKAPLSHLRIELRGTAFACGLALPRNTSSN